MAYIPQVVEREMDAQTAPVEAQEIGRQTKGYSKFSPVCAKRRSTGGIGSRHGYDAST
jgi:hypothetical protein